jgi:hypothetical protein
MSENNACHERGWDVVRYQLLKCELVLMSEENDYSDLVVMRPVLAGRVVEERTKTQAQSEESQARE